MTSLSRRNRPTTARRITPLTLAASAVAALAFFAAPGVAQPPGDQKVGQLPPPPQSRYLPVSPAAFAQPDAKGKTTTAQKKQVKIPPVPPEYIQLPPRESIFMVYDDLQLEKAIMEEIRKQLRKDKKEIDERSLVFPPLPVISPPGVAYESKTAAYPPRQVIVEPGYVVHRRLHFEEKNAERYGWDLGPMQTLVSASYFWRDALLWPQSLATSCVRGPWDTSAGKCLPGSPVPYYLYPPGLTITGTAVEGAVITGAAFILP